MTFKDYQNNYHHPVNNFNHANFWGKNSEHEFGNHFVRWFGSLSDKKIVAIRELPIPGSGIADFVVVKKHNCTKTDKPRTIVQAFEFKIKDWRKGLMQAHRYKYFSNSSILVVPSHTIKPAQKSIDLFKQLGVGLWAFNASAGIVTKTFTPRPKKVLDARRAAYVLNKAYGDHLHICERSL